MRVYEFAFGSEQILVFKDITIRRVCDGTSDKRHARHFRAKFWELDAAYAPRIKSTSVCWFV